MEPVKGKPNQDVSQDPSKKVSTGKVGNVSNPILAEKAVQAGKPLSSWAFSLMSSGGQGVVSAIARVFATCIGFSKNQEAEGVELSKSNTHNLKALVQSTKSGDAAKISEIKGKLTSFINNYTIKGNELIDEKTGKPVPNDTIVGYKHKIVYPPIPIIQIKAGELRDLFSLAPYVDSSLELIHSGGQEIGPKGKEFLTLSKWAYKTKESPNGEEKFVRKTLEFISKNKSRAGQLETKFNTLLDRLRKVKDDRDPLISKRKELLAEIIHETIDKPISDTTCSSNLKRIQEIDGKLMSLAKNVRLYIENPTKHPLT